MAKKDEATIFESQIVYSAIAYAEKNVNGKQMPIKMTEVIQIIQDYAEKNFKEKVSILQKQSNIKTLVCGMLKKGITENAKGFKLYLYKKSDEGVLVKADYYKGYVFADNSINFDQNKELVSISFNGIDYSNDNLYISTQSNL